MDPAEPRTDAPRMPATADALRSLIDSAPLPAVLLDANARIVHVNEAEQARGGRGSAELAGTSFFEELVPGLARQGLEARYRQQLAGGAVRLDVTAEMAGTRGKQVALLRLRSVAGGDARRGVAWIEDRTAIVAEEERRKRAERLAAVGELAAGVAHEVNNPLASIKSFAQLLARDAQTDEQRRALEIIVHESTRVAGIVGNLLSFARQQGVTERSTVNLNTIAERVLALQQYALQTAGIEVRLDFDTELSPVVGETGALEQVLLNLVVNAEQALSSIEGERRIIIRTRESSEGVMLSIVDNGPGIPRELLSEIFDPFRTTKPNGTGLGLGISAAIVRDHGGHIWAESEENRGSAFFVRLPRALAPSAPRPEPQSPADEPPRRPLRILIADDEPALRLALSVFLSRRGHQVVQAADAYEAFDLASAQDFDAALVDARMPGDGLVLLERLESLPALQGRTALMTGDLGRARTTQGIATGRPFLSKPFDMDEMVRLVETLGR
jgi:two-component system, NtrC family, sensor kinase